MSVRELGMREMRIREGKAQLRKKTSGRRRIRVRERDSYGKNKEIS